MEVRWSLQILFSILRSDKFSLVNTRGSKISGGSFGSNGGGNKMVSTMVLLEVVVITVMVVAVVVIKVVVAVVVIVLAVLSLVAKVVLLVVIVAVVIRHHQSSKACSNLSSEQALSFGDISNAGHTVHEHCAAMMAGALVVVVMVWLWWL